MASKSEYVLSRPQTNNHTCHWPGCTRRVPPAMWGCKPHWTALPQYLRAQIWATYQPGQEETKNPSPAYLRAARAAQEWIRTQEQAQAETGPVCVNCRHKRGEGRCFEGKFCVYISDAQPPKEREAQTQ